MLPVQGFGDEHLPEDGVDVEHLVGRLVRSHPGDAVADGDVLVLVRADLQDQRDPLAGKGSGASATAAAEEFPFCLGGLEAVGGEVKFNISVWER